MFWVSGCQSYPWKPKQYNEFVNKVPGEGFSNHYRRYNNYHHHRITGWLVKWCQAKDFNGDFEKFPGIVWRGPLIVVRWL